MNLYHYSTGLHDQLMTRRKAGNLTKEEIKQAERESAVRGLRDRPYIDHISFFFDPIPSVVLSRIFGTNHPVWYTGNKLYEYTVPVDSLQDGFPFDVVESARRLKLLDEFSKEHNWVENNAETLRKWRTVELTNKLEWGEIGFGKQALKVQMLNTSGHLDKAFLNAYSRDDFEDGRMKYAANVPHVMIYPIGGIIDYAKVEQLTIGSNKRGPVQ